MVVVEITKTVNCRVVEMEWVAVFVRYEDVGFFRKRGVHIVGRDLCRVVCRVI